jgi:hypothetical protein
MQVYEGRKRSHRFEEFSAEIIIVDVNPKSRFESRRQAEHGE